MTEPNGSAIEVREVDYRDEQDPSVTIGWRIGDVPTLDWALGRISELKQEAADNEASVAHAKALLDMRLKKLNEQIERGIAFFQERVREYAEANRERLLGTGKKKSRKLPHGSVGWRSTSTGLRVVNEDELLAWAQSQPVELGLVRIKEEPAVKAIKAYAEPLGLIPPGMEWDAGEDRLEIKPVELRLQESGEQGGSDE